MAKRDLYSNIGVSTTIAPAVVSATGNGTGVDLRGFQSATVAYTVGAIVGSGNITPKLQESDDNSTFTDVAAGDLLGSFPAVLLTGTAFRVGYKGSKRYIRAVSTLNSGTSVAVSAVVLLGHPELAPVA